MSIRWSVIRGQEMGQTVYSLSNTLSHLTDILSASYTLPHLIPCKLMILLQVSSKSILLESSPSPRDRLKAHFFMVPFVLILLVALHLNYLSTSLSPCQTVTFDFIFPASLYFNLGWIPSAECGNFMEDTQKSFVQWIKSYSKMRKSELLMMKKTNNFQGIYS